MRIKTLSILLLVTVGTLCLAQGGKGMRGGAPFTFASGLAPWTGVNNQQVLMKLVGMTPDGKVIFQKEDGKTVVTPLTNLQDESQARIRECEQKMQEAGYTNRSGYWYSAEDLAEAERLAAERAAEAAAQPAVRTAPKPKMECRLTMKKDRENPGNYGLGGRRWNVLMGGRPITYESVARTVEVDVQSFSAADESYEVRWYVVGRPYSFKEGRGQSGPAQIVETYTETVNCKPQGFAHLQWTTQSYPDTKEIKDLSSRLLKAQRVLRTIPDGAGGVEGISEFQAVVVQLVQDGKLLRSFSSAPVYSVTAETFPFTVNKP